VAAVAIAGAIIVGEHEGPFTNLVTYRRRCEACEYLACVPPITVSCLPYQTAMHGCYHQESFVCSFCGNRQEVKIEG
jgi:hypothetical protein